MKRLCAAILIVISCAGPGVSVAEEQIDLASRPGVTQTVFYTAAPGASRTVILFTGGHGVVDARRNNFLLRVAGSFVAQGMNVAIPQVPSDHAGGMLDGFRASAEHATDMAAVIAMIQQRSRAPIWLVGTSRGTVSAASVAVRIGPPRVAGLVLTSSVWPDLMAVTALDAVLVPTLVVHNRDDGCRESPFSAAADGLAALRRAAVKEMIVVSGGASRSAPCEALSPHGYYGIEGQVVPGIVAWIRAH